MRRHVSSTATPRSTSAYQWTRQTTTARHIGTRGRVSVGRPLLRGGVVATVAALIAATVAVQPAAAAPTDVNQAEGVLVSGSGIADIDTLAQLASAYSARGQAAGGGTTAQPVDLTALNALDVDLGNDVDLLGQNGILTLGVADQYASTTATGATASSGVVANDGGIGVGTGTTGTGATVNLNPLLGRVGADTSLLADAQLSVGAIASTITATRGQTVTTSSDYRIAGATLRLQSPAVQGLTGALQQDLRTYSGTVNSTIGANGALSGVTTQLTATLQQLLRTTLLGSAVTVNGTTVTASVNLNLDDTLTQVLRQPLTDGAVTLVPSTGVVTVDLDRLTTLNGQPANTSVLTAATVASINSSIATILGTQLPTALQTAVVNTVNSTAVRVDVTAQVGTALGQLTPIGIRIDSTLGQLAGSTPGQPTITVTQGPLGLDVLGGLLTPAVRTIVVPAVQNLVRPLVTGTALTNLGTTLTGTTSAVSRLLAPAVVLIRQAIDITVNAQDTTTGFRDPRGTDDGSRSVHALRLAVLPGVNASTVDLATSTVRTTAFTAPTITAPTADQVLTVPTADATRSVTVSGAGEPGATIAVDLGNGITGTATVGADGTWTTTIAGVPAGQRTATATQTVGTTPAGTATQDFTVAVQRPLVITTPVEGRTFTITGDTTPVTLTGTATAGATIAVDLGNGRTATGTADGTGAWTATVPGLPVGTYTASVTQTVGDTTSAARTRSFSIVRAADLSVTTPTEGQDFTVLGATDTRPVPFAGRAQAGATVTVDLGAGRTATTTAGADGTWSTSVADVPVGTYTARVTQTVDGTTSTPLQRGFTVSAADPVRIATPADGSTIAVADADATTAVTVTGTAEPGARVDVSIGGAFAAIVPADGGTWTATFAGVPVGPRTVTAIETVDGQTSGPATSTFTVAAGQPVTITAPDDGTTIAVIDADTTVDVPVRGTADPGATVDVALGTGLTARTQAGTDGTWAVTVADVPVGRFTVQAIQTVRDTTSAADPRVVTVVPAAPLRVTAPDQGDTTAVATAGSTLDVPVTGSAQPGSTVTVVLDGGAPATTTAGADGNWTTTLPGVGTGPHTVTVTQTVGGVTGPATERNFTIAVGAPVVIDSPSAGQQVPAGGDGTAQVIVTGTAEPGATVTVRLDGGAPVDVVADGSGSWTAPATGSTPLAIGAHGVTAVETVNGTTGPTVDRDFTVVPGRAVTIDTPPTGSRYVVLDGTTATVDIAGTAQPGAAVSVVVGGGTPLTTTADPTTGAWTVRAPGLAPAGPVTIGATQEIGGVRTEALPITIQVVAATPVTITTPVAGADPVLVAGPLATVGVPVTGTAQAGATLTVRTPGAPDQTTTVQPDGTWSVTVPGLGVGDHTVSATQTLGGATSDPVQRTVTVKAAAAVTVTTPSDGDTLVVADAGTTRDVPVAGTAQPGAPVTVTLDGTDGTDVATTADGDGDWTVVFPGVGEGDHTVTATQTVGGTTAPSPATDFTVAAVAPIAIDQPTDGTVVRVADATGTVDLRTSGTAEPRATVDVTLSSGPAATVTADADGRWTTTFADVPVGELRVAAVQTVQGQVSGPVSAGVTVQAGAPLTVTDPAGTTRVVVADADATTAVAFAGTGDPDATVTVDLGRGLTATAEVGDDGRWATTVPTVPVGTRAAEVTQSLGGTTSLPVSREVVVTAAAPLTVTQPAGPVTVADDDATTTVPVGGTAEPGATVSVGVDDRDPVETTVGGDGTWTVDVPDLGTGTHTVTAEQTVGDSTSTTPVTGTVRVVAAAPVVVTTPTAGQEYRVADADASTTVTVRGTAEPSAPVTVDLGRGDTATTTADADGRWAVDVTDVAPGDVTVSVTQQVGDTRSTPVTVPVRVVVADPLTIGVPQGGSTVLVADAGDTTTVTAQGTADDGATVRVTLDGGDPVDVTATDGRWSVDLDGLGTGDHTVSATQTVGGTTSAPVTTTFTVAAARALTVDAPADGLTVTVPVGTTDTDLPVNGSGQPGATVRVVLDDRAPVEVTVGTDGRWSTELDGVRTGDHTVTATQVVRDTTSAPVVRDLTVATAAVGDVVVTAPLAGSVVRTLADTVDVPVSGTAVAGADVSVTVDGGTPVTTTADGEGDWSVTVPGVGLGAHTVSATQTVAGTTSAATDLPFSLIAATPVTVTSPTDGQTVPATGTTVSVPVSGTAEPGAAIAVTVDGQTVPTTAGDDGSWTVTVGDLPVGDHTIAVTETVAGVTSDPVTTGITVAAVGDGDVVITSPTSGQLIPADGMGDTGTIHVVGTAAAGATVTVTLSDGQVRTTTADADGNWDVTFTAVPEGRWTITAVQTVRGTQSTAPEVVVTLDAVDPLAVADPDPGEHRAANDDGWYDWPVMGTAEPGATVTVWTDGVDRVVDTADADGTWSVVLRLGVGSHVVRATQTVGGVTSAVQTVPVVVDAVALQPGTPGTPGNPGTPGTPGAPGNGVGGNGALGGIPAGAGTGTGRGNGTGVGTGSGSGAPGGALAVTGADVAPLAGTAGGILVLGLVLLGLSRLARRFRERTRS